MKHLIAGVAVVCVAACGQANAQDRNLELGFRLGVAGAGAEIKKPGGGTLTIESGEEAAIGAALRYDIPALSRGETGWRGALIGDLYYHDLKNTVTDADLGQVKIQTRFSGAIKGQFGYDFGRVKPYASLGLGFHDTSVSTNGATLDTQISVVPEVGLGVAVSFNDKWSGLAELTSTGASEFTANGGGATNAGVGKLMLGIQGKF